MSDSVSCARRLWALGAFAVAMAYLESAVVVHLRTIFYPGGFRFPLVEVDSATALIELGREAATLVMLAAVARISGRCGWGRFACFAFLFGFWDIWYYVWLKVFVSWPASLFTWDVLFLIPIPWVGPVLAPVLVSVLLVVGSIRAMVLIDRGARILVDRWDWACASTGALVVLYTFLAQAADLLADRGLAGLGDWVPTDYDWAAFGLGLGLMAAATLRISSRSSRTRREG